MVDADNPKVDYGSKGCLLLDLVCMATTLMGLVSHKRAKRLVGLIARCGEIFGLFVLLLLST